MHAENDIRFDETELSCAVCDHDHVVVDPDGSVTCPACHESYSLVVHEKFTLLETDGWATRISFEIPDERRDVPS